MHVGLNLIFLTPGMSGGMEIYARELIPELVAAAPQHRFTAFLSREAAASPGPWNEAVEAITVPVRAGNRIEWVRGEQQLLPPIARRAGVDLVHSLASTGPAWGRFARVVTIHDLIYRVVPAAHPGLRALGMRLLVPLAARRSHRVIAISESTRDDVRRHLHIAPDRVDLVPQGIGTTRRAAPMSEPGIRAMLAAGDRRIVLSVSAKLPHKNLVRLLGALASIPGDRRPLLVLPGYPTPHEAQLRSHAERLGVQADVRLLGWVADEELEGLYAAAACFVFPSLYEGFGLPVLEAMARGVPVACSSRGSLGEVAGDAALVFDPESETGIASAIERLLHDDALAERLRAAGRERAGRFTWAATAAGTLRAYERATRQRA